MAHADLSFVYPSSCCRYNEAENPEMETYSTSCRDIYIAFAPAGFYVYA